MTRSNLNEDTGTRYIETQNLCYWENQGRPLAGNSEQLEVIMIQGTTNEEAQVKETPSDARYIRWTTQLTNVAERPGRRDVEVPPVGVLLVVYCVALWV